ncbi:death domain-containing protein CRADD isoform X1 [Clupea harengus]|uniref:Death domain-containing protein CRADD isoform X1 n=1 Tax=Clupea harengus TaxID=7950 RepID=A0A6P8GM98_CLUHA|nr:death domain-containing protein CRADD isoform X1 [Clupea harengus]
MESRHKDILRKNRLDLSLNISTDDTIVQYLYQEDILTLNHVEEIQAQASSKNRTLMLLDILPARGPKAFGKFLESLEAEYPWVRERLLQGLDNAAVQVTSTGHGMEEVGVSQRKGCFRVFPSRVLQRLDHWDVPESVLQLVPSDLQLNKLAGRLGPEWVSVLLDLGLSTEDVYRCRTSDPFTMQNQVLAGLVLWKQRSGRTATVHRLIQSLRAAELHPSILDQVPL